LFFINPPFLQSMKSRSFIIQFKRSMVVRCWSCQVTAKQIEVFSPASIANLGPGFDVFGIALDGLGDTLSVELVPEPGVKVIMKGPEAESIPSDPGSNSAGAVLQYVLKNYDSSRGFVIEVEKGVPPGKGMGSSGASAAGAAYAAIQLLGLELSDSEAVRLAAQGEAAVAGSPHADNVSASLLGGFVMVGDDYDVVRLDPPMFDIVVVVPDVYYENKTRLARSLLPEKVLLKNAVHNVGSASRMAAAIALGDAELFGRSISDKLVEPRRAEMIPGFWNVKQAALDAGALGCSISGGGPSLFAVGGDTARVGKAMAEAFKEAGVASEIYQTRPSRLGARTI
jgi:homoserine kinase